MDHAWTAIKKLVGYCISPFDYLQKVHQLPTQTKPYNTPPLKRRDSRSAGHTGGRVNIEAVSFTGDTEGRIFSSLTWEKFKDFGSSNT